MSQEDIVQVVDPIAKKYGVPTGLWETIVQVESGWDPLKVGDQGSSFGLFQLHRGGELGNLTPQEAFDSSVNANQAMPFIAKAWKSLKATANPNSLDWWIHFASISGHPAENGNILDPSVVAEGQRLYDTYNKSYASPQPLPKPPPAPNLIQQIENSVLHAIVDPITGAISQVGPKVAIFALALVLILVGIFALVKGQA